MNVLMLMNVATFKTHTQSVMKVSVTVTEVAWGIKKKKKSSDLVIEVVNRLR